MIRLLVNHYWKDSKGNHHRSLWKALRGRRCSHPLCTKRVNSPYTLCEKHRAESEQKKWEKLPISKYVGQPIYSYALDRYFFDDGALADYIDEFGTDMPLHFVECSPQRLKGFDWWDLLHDDLPDDMGPQDVLPDPILRLMSGLNDELSKERPILCWYPGKRRILDEDLPIFAKEIRA